MRGQPCNERDNSMDALNNLIYFNKMGHSLFNEKLLFCCGNSSCASKKQNSLSLAVIRTWNCGQNIERTNNKMNALNIIPTALCLQIVMFIRLSNDLVRT